MREFYKGNHKSTRRSMTSIKEFYRIYERMHVVYEGIHEIANKDIRAPMKSISRIYKGIHGIYMGNL